MARVDGSEVITLDDFSDWHEEVRGVEIRSHLPLPAYAPAENIGVDVFRIARIARLGRLQSVRLGIASVEGDYEYSVQGINPDGSATAAKIRAGSVARSLQQLQPGAGDDVFPRGNSVIRVNVDHPDLKNNQLRQPEAWAKLMNKGVKDGLKKSTKEQLLEPRSKRIPYFLIGKSIDAVMGLPSAVLWGDMRALAGFMAWMALCEGTGFTSYARNRDYEKSFLRGMPYDRYIAAMATLATKKIVKPLPQTQKQVQV